MAEERSESRLDGVERHEVVVVGGGAAGLSGALALARARRSVLVIDEGRPRNAPADGVHGYLGLEGTPPAELLARGRAEATGYGARFTEGRVVSAERGPDGFRLGLADGSAVLADRLLVATGLVDELPEIPGLAERFGRDVLHCPYCHGWEVRDRSVGVLATGANAEHLALLWRQWSGDVTLFAHTAPELDDEQRERLAARGVTVVTGRVAGLRVDDDRLAGVELADGRTVPVAVVAVGTFLAARSDLLAALGLAPVPQEMAGQVIGSRVPADPTGATEVPGVWVAGNVTQLAEQVIGAAAAGLRAGAAINADLVAEDTRRAVATARAAREVLA
ncbi:NAD(P)/FAD-dependent oxidoreductase [Streptomyces millisiae]|uniref:NAD(P)/FAD-dependent oxidoreductase n=1 Tax=Streptomyces millisiae TaxID=3075542 RepID=A0ABU2LIK0_9ACTN|nr:NAD(P)/FAD-dependent oxidoreductase [Streptomyces sp. DSM 44918]MDT0317315.1 NAD(P)/FAD-dependent oxidoreductase [Streptomyces sp. DSM 44918]